MSWDSQDLPGDEWTIAPNMNRLPAHVGSHCVAGCDLPPVEWMAMHPGLSLALVLIVCIGISGGLEFHPAQWMNRRAARKRRSKPEEPQA